MAVNKVILVGNVGKDPEVHYIDTDVAVAKFSLATSESYKNKEGVKITTTEWHNITLWRGLAKVAEKYVKKGDLLFIEGKIKTRSYDDKEGIKRYSTDIIGDNMRMLGKRSSNDGGHGSNTQYPNSGNSQDTDQKSVSEPENNAGNNNASNEPDEANDLPF